MSTSISYLFNATAADLKELVDRINKCIGCNLTAYDNREDSYLCWFLGSHLTLSDTEGYENDGEVNVESFSYELDLKVSEVNSKQRQLIAALLIVQTLFEQLGITGILVYNLQIVLARYIGKNINHKIELFDTISNTQIFPLQTYLKILLSKLSEHE